MPVPYEIIRARTANIMSLIGPVLEASLANAAGLGDDIDFDVENFPADVSLTVDFGDCMIDLNIGRGSTGGTLNIQ